MLPAQPVLKMHFVSINGKKGDKHVSAHRKQRVSEKKQYFF